MAFFFPLCYNLCLSFWLPLVSYLFSEICFLKRRIKDVVHWQSGSGCQLSFRGQHVDCIMGRSPWIGKQDQAFLQGHVISKNLPALDKSKYSRNGFVVRLFIPTKSQGIFKELIQTMSVYENVFIYLSSCYFQ